MTITANAKCTKRIERSILLGFTCNKTIISAEQNLKISQDNYNAGVITLSELFEAQNLLQQSYDQYIETATQCFQKQAKWKQVSGK
ncbi:MAG: TolC family protein [Bacteroidales bacterium]|nr:TolC family protein [Bacteroidales bacterium]